MSDVRPPASTEPPPSPPGRGRVGTWPAVGCVVALLALVIVFGTAVGGSFQSLALLGVLVLVGGVAVIFFLAKKNREAP
ncbi:MAG TPA: hypothetical protein VFV54_06520 [Thermoanaerobaculia bacterium]|nr:hypothetical protein [Thermoanaerobaculia bacterium]